MNRLVRALRVLERYRPEELVRWTGLQLARGARRGIPPLEYGTRLEGAVRVAAARRALLGLRSIAVPANREEPTLYRIQRAAHLDRIHDYPGLDPWPVWISHAYQDDKWGWYPYSTSTRLLLWVLRVSAEAVPDDDVPAVAAGLRDHIRFTLSHLETHLGGNHLLRQLISATLGLRAIGETDGELDARAVEEAHGQFLEDGLHFENSPMYHGHAVFDMLLLADALRGTGLRGDLDRLLGVALSRLKALTKPDGSYARFGDSTDGLVPSTRQLFALAEAVAAQWVGPRKELQSGLWTRHWGQGNWLAFRAGARAPRTCPGHWHDDLLAIELSARGIDIFENAGVYGYDPDGDRAYARSARAHSTLDPLLGQAETWGAFRVGRTPSLRAIDYGPNHCTGEYSPSALPAASLARTVQLDVDRDLITLRDQVRGLKSVGVRFLCSPDVFIRHADGVFKVFGPNGATVTLAGEPVRFLGVSETDSFPSFGERATAHVLSFEVTERVEWTIRCSPES